MAGFDLAQTQARVARQDRQVDRRSGIIEEVDTRQRGRQIFGEMRNARRGGGKGEALMEALGVLNRGVQDLGQVATKREQKKEDEREAKGQFDGAAGIQDEELQKKSRGYRDGLALGRARSDWSKHKAATDTEFQAFIEGQQELTLEERQKNAAQWIEQHYFHDFVVDPDTKQAKNFGAPGAYRALAGIVTEQRAGLMEAANQRIEQRMNGEALTHFTDYVRSTAADGSFDLNEGLKMLPAGIPQETVTKTYIETATVVANEMSRNGDNEGAIRVLDQVLGYGQVSSVIPVEIPAGGGAAPAPATAAAVQQKIGRLTIAADKLAAEVMHQESRGNANAVSSEGAVGTMQTMPNTLRDPGYGVKPAKDNSPAELERVGKDYLKALGKHYNGVIALQLAAYNAGPGTINDWLAGTNKTGKNPQLLHLPDPRKKGVSEQQFWAQIPFKETKDYVRNITARAGQPVATGGGEDALAEANPDFQLPAEKPDLDARAKAPGFRILPELQGRFALSAAQRNSLLEQRDQMLNKGRQQEAFDKRQKQDARENGFAMRLMGQGPALTTQDVLDAVQTGDFDGQTGGKWLKAIESQREAEISHANAVAAQADHEADKRREEEAARILNGYGASVIGAKMPPEVARRQMLLDLEHIKDPLVRYQVMQQSATFFNSIESIRLDTPEARTFASNADKFEGQMVAGLGGRVLKYNGRSITPDQAHGLIKQKVDEIRVRGGKDFRDFGSGPDEKAVLAELTSWMNATFPPKQAVAKPK